MKKITSVIAAAAILLGSTTAYAVSVESPHCDPNFGDCNITVTPAAGFDDYGSKYAVDTHPDGTVVLSQFAYDIDYCKNNPDYRVTALIPSVNVIDAQVFQYAEPLEAVTIPLLVKTICDRAFEGCHNLKTVTFNGFYVERMGEWVFADCPSLEEIKLPAHIKEISAHTFDGCSGLTSVAMSNGITKIDDHAFLGCVSLEEIKIPYTVTEIGEGAFEDCSGLETVTLPFSLTSIEAGTFSGCSGLTSVTIPEGVTSIGEYAFWGCSNLESIDIPDGVTKIEDNTFGGCSKLTSVTIPEGVTSIGEGAFANCTGLKSITIPESVTSIGMGAFEGCKNLKSVTLPDGITSIGEKVFKDCSSLSSVTMPGVTNIGMEAFRGCGFSSLTIPESVKSLGAGAFFGNHSLSSVTLPERFTEIGAGAFADCWQLTSAFYPAYDKYLSYYGTPINDTGIYEGCSATSAVIADGVETIMPNSFAECWSLKSVIIPASVKTVHFDAFDECTNLKDVYYAGTAEQWSEVSFYTGNDALLNARIHYDSDGSKPEQPSVSITVPNSSEGAPEITDMRIAVTRDENQIASVTVGEHGTVDLSDVPDGDYMFTFSAAHCAPRSYAVTVSNGAPSGLEDGVELHLYGDINGDGDVDIKDVAKANMYFKNGSGLEGYELSVSDVNVDDIIDIKDVAKMNAHFKQTGNLWQ